MSGKSSRSKGANAELEIMRKFKAWWEPIAPDSQWARVPLSGGWGTSGQRKGFKACGDIMTTCEIFPFTVEVKRREGWVMSTLMAGKKSPVWSWWAQAMRQGKEADLLPMLVFRKSRMEWLAMVDVMTILGKCPNEGVVLPREKPTDRLQIVRIMQLSDLLKTDPKEILTLNEQPKLRG